MKLFRMLCVFTLVLHAYISGNAAQNDVTTLFGNQSWGTQQSTFTTVGSQPKQGSIQTSKTQSSSASARQVQQTGDPRTAQAVEQAESWLDKW